MGGLTRQDPPYKTILNPNPNPNHGKDGLLQDRCNPNQDKDDHLSLLWFEAVGCMAVM